jgi:hypothetical protein
MTMRTPHHNKTKLHTIRLWILIALMLALSLLVGIQPALAGVAWSG